jgi:hypothetical protein
MKDAVSSPNEISDLMSIANGGGYNPSLGPNSLVDLEGVSGEDQPAC